MRVTGARFSALRWWTRLSVQMSLSPPHSSPVHSRNRTSLIATITRPQNGIVARIITRRGGKAAAALIHRPAPENPIGRSGYTRSNNPRRATPPRCPSPNVYEPAQQPVRKSLRLRRAAREIKHVGGHAAEEHPSGHCGGGKEVKIWEALHAGVVRNKPVSPDQKHACRR